MTVFREKNQQMFPERDLVPDLLDEDFKTVRNTLILLKEDVEKSRKWQVNKTEKKLNRNSSPEKPNT